MNKRPDSPHSPNRDGLGAHHPASPVQPVQAGLATVARGFSRRADERIADARANVSRKAVNTGNDWATSG